MRWRIGGALATLTVAAAGVVAQFGSARAEGPVRSDVEAIYGHYGVSNGFSDRDFFTAWGNSYFAGGLGVHAEVTQMDREERATYFAGGLSYNTQGFSLRGTLGSSTDNLNILPELFARLEATFRSSPQTGWVLIPAVTHREY